MRNLYLVKDFKKDNSFFISLNLLLSRYFNILKYLNLFLKSFNYILLLLKKNILKFF